MRIYILLVLYTFFLMACSSSQKNNKLTSDNKSGNSEASSGLTANQETHRPQFHFTPPANWMNDPNGMVYYAGEYHLFYQHNPDSTVWGPMHWGHAVSQDLVHWEHLPIALYPDSLGTIFSGSAVVDLNNTSGFGTKEKPAMVAIYTSAGKTQRQSIAFSLDKGRTWTKYKNNPVLLSPGIPDFRDPKVSWNEKAQQWIMTLAVADHISFYSSKNLKDWHHESDFGQNIGGHGGVWECPDLFKLPVDGTNQEKWVLLVSINPGGPNGGSATQYFVGDFDGNRFVLDKQFEQQLSQKKAMRKGSIFADFEGKSYGNWKVEGDAFGTAPAGGTLPNQQKVNDYFGKGLVNSYQNGDKTTGKLISPEFTINANYINLLVGGGKHPEKTAVNLLVDDKVVKRATGNNSESLRWVAWDSKELKGKKARIEIADNVKEGWGHILVDQITFSDEPAKESIDGIWLDYGTDNYAGITWSNVPESDGRRLFLGWMSNWLYANEVPTTAWRSAMTVPRELKLYKTEAGIRLANVPVKELQKLRTTTTAIKGQTVTNSLNLSTHYNLNTSLLELDLNLDLTQSQEIVLKLSNAKGEHLDVGYSVAAKELYIDRTKSGKTSFKDNFSGKHTAPLTLVNGKLKLHVLLDVASVEVFANEGKAVMTDIFFPNENYTQVELVSTGPSKIQESKAYALKSIW